MQINHNSSKFVKIKFKFKVNEKKIRKFQKIPVPHTNREIYWKSRWRGCDLYFWNGRKAKILKNAWMNDGWMEWYQYIQIMWVRFLRPKTFWFGFVVFGIRLFDWNFFMSFGLCKHFVRFLLWPKSIVNTEIFLCNDWTLQVQFNRSIFIVLNFHFLCLCRSRCWCRYVCSCVYLLIDGCV